MIKKILTIGAAICLIIGLFTSKDLISVIVTHWGWSDLSTYLRYPDAYIFSIYAFVAFIPIILLFWSKNIENPKYRFVLIGIIEFLIIFMYLGMILFPPKI